MTIKQDLKCSAKGVQRVGKKDGKIDQDNRKVRESATEKDHHQTNQNHKGETKNDDGKENRRKGNLLTRSNNCHWIRHDP